MVGSLVRDLARSLAARGLAAEVVGASMVWAVNRAVDGEDPVGRAMSPGLRQAVACRPDEDGRLLWWWVWSGPTRDAPSEYEPLGPAADVEAAADRIVSVLRLDGVSPEATA
ncbi:hypothetical protein [Actinoallomurus soli]|uniref:hypothetical protein n=1 Tax=Actinoallomurus soli TaxID=2952535 RepID=UPI0020922C82|nr:hypothetical protein [Actinoallomurus soli]MCO5971140.1 hypothetical protein [Actinoallomurus soli]